MIMVTICNSILQYKAFHSLFQFASIQCMLSCLSVIDCIMRALLKIATKLCGEGVWVVWGRSLSWSKEVKGGRGIGGNDAHLFWWPSTKAKFQGSIISIAVLYLAYLLEIQCWVIEYTCTYTHPGGQSNLFSFISIIWHINQ